MRTLISIILMVVFCTPVFGECGVADSPTELGRVGKHLEYLMTKVKDTYRGIPFYGIVAWCPTDDGRFKWAYEAVSFSESNAYKAVGFKFDSCSGNCSGSVRYIIKKSTEK